VYIIWTKLVKRGTGLIAIFLISGLVLPAQSRAKTYSASNSPYGVNLTANYWFFSKAPEWPYPERNQMLADAGVRWVVVHIYQSNFDPVKGNFLIEKLDHYLQSVNNEGLKISAALFPARGNEIARGIYDEYYPGGLRKNWSVWENFVRFIVGRYGPKGQNLIRTWFIENEPDLPLGSDARDIYHEDEQLYLDLVEKTYFWIKDPATGEDPNATIVSSAMSQLHLSDGDIVDRWLAAGLGDYFSAFAFNFYGSSTDDLVSLYQQATHLLAKNGYGDKQIWVRETNIGSSHPDPANEIVNRYQTMINLGAKKVSWFPEDASPPMFGPGLFNEPDGRHFGTYVPNDLYYSLQQMARADLELPVLTGTEEPTPGTTIPNRQPIKFRWQKAILGSHPIEEYLVQVATESAFFAPKTYSAGSNLEIEVSPLPAGDYLWRVKAVDSYQNHGRWSEAVSFRVAPFCLSCLQENPAKSEGNANCDSRINLTDFNLWLSTYRKIIDGQSVTEEEKAPLDFDCQEDNPNHIVNLSDFIVWLNSYQAVLD